MSLIAPVRKVSAWQFITFGSGGLSIGIFAASGGKMILKDPSGKEHTFIYGGAGAGLSLGAKLPKLGKMKVPTPTGAGGPTSFPSTGMVLANKDLPGGDLKKSDIQGLCTFVEVGGGFITGGSGTAMLVGLNPLLLPLITTLPGVGSQLFTNSAKGMIMMAGLNIGVQAQVGVSGYIGYLK